nr:ribonuclease H [Tanacetum cinerariifolium]
KVVTSQRFKSLNDTVVDAQEDASKQGGIAELYANEDVTLVDVDTTVEIDADTQRRMEEDVTAAKEINAAEPTVFDDEEEKEDLERAKVLQQQYDQKQEIIDWNVEEVYVNQPDGFVDPYHPDKVYRLKKALYGLKQAPRALYDELSNFLIHQSPRGIFINQAKYAQEILIKHGITSCDSVGTPMATKHLDADLSEYGFHFDKIPMYCDSKAAIAISCNPVQHSRTKHIDVRYHFIKEKVEKGIVELFFIKIEYQLADMFTKALPEERFKYLIKRLGMRCLTPDELEVLANESA